MPISILYPKDSVSRTTHIYKLKTEVQELRPDLTIFKNNSLNRVRQPLECKNTIETCHNRVAGKGTCHMERGCYSNKISYIRYSNVLTNAKVVFYLLSVKNRCLHFQGGYTTTF
jgi:hypothetical protein